MAVYLATVRSTSFKNLARIVDDRDPQVDRLILAVPCTTANFRTRP